MTDLTELDALTIAAILSFIVVGIVAAIEVIVTGALSAGLLALLVGVAGPVIPSLLARTREDKRNRRR